MLLYSAQECERDRSSRLTAAYRSADGFIPAPGGPGTPTQSCRAQLESGRRRGLMEVAVAARARVHYIFIRSKSAALGENLGSAHAETSQRRGRPGITIRYFPMFDTSPEDSVSGKQSQSTNIWSYFFGLFYIPLSAKRALLMSELVWEEVVSATRFLKTGTATTSTT